MTSFCRNVCFLVVLAALAACSSAPPPPPGTHHTDAGSTGVSQLGASCRADTDCGPLLCDTNIQGGYCSAQCSTNADCPSNGVCGMLLGQGACLQSCTADSGCRSGQVCDSATGGCMPACAQSSDCGNGQYCDNTGHCQNGCGQDSDCGASGSGMFCNTSTNTCMGGCNQDSSCPTGMTCNTATNQCVTPEPTPDAGTTIPDAGTTTPDAGTTVPDAGTTVSDAGTAPDAGPLPCSDYADPNTMAACHCKTGQTCTANNCYGGYYCRTTDNKCVAPPANCTGGSADAGTTPVDAGTTPADAGTLPLDGGSTGGSCTSCTKGSCGTGKFCDCVDAACSQTTCTVSCPSSSTCPQSGWTCQMATPASSTTGKMYNDCLPANDTCQ